MTARKLIVVAVLVGVGLAGAAVRLYMGEQAKNPAEPSDTPTFDRAPIDAGKGSGAGRPRDEAPVRDRVGGSSSKGAARSGERSGGATGGAALDGEPAAAGTTDTAPTEAPADATYTDSPTTALQTRLDTAADRLPEGRAVANLSVFCTSGGKDCVVTGAATTPEDVQTFIAEIEAAPAAEGEGGTPTVEMKHSSSDSSGATSFELGVYYP